MSQVSVTINGRQFRMACEDGQEGHLIELARELDTRIGGLRTKFGEIGDTRLTVMAAITVADELAEATLRIARLEEELAASQDARVMASDRTRAAQAAIASTLAAAAERIESVTKKLDQSSPAGSDVAMG
jgi:cell division protein ZapA